MPDLELIVSDFDTQKPGLELTDSVVALRWCVSKKTLEELEKRDAKNPHLLIVVTHRNEEMDRYLVPLGQMMEYIQFTKPGENRILAAIVWNKDGDVGELREYFFEKNEKREYIIDVLDYHVDIHRFFEGAFSLSAKAELDIHVDKEFFAPEPSPREKWWVNLWFVDTAPRDQCQFRKRRIPAYTIQPLLVFVWWVIKTTIVLLLGSISLVRGVRDFRKEFFGNIFHPFTYEIEDLGRCVKSDDSVFLRAKRGGERRHFLILAMRPTILFWSYSILLFVAVLIAIGVKIPITWSLILAVLLVDFLVITVVSMIGFLGYKLIDFVSGRFLSKLVNRWVERSKERKKQEIEREAVEESVRIQRLTCTSDLATMKADIKAIPAENRTIHLRFQDLKKKVCRPFAR